METAKATIDDTTLTAKVKAALLAKSELNSTAISVTTREGQVTLDGQLPPQQIAQAEQVARGIEGVRSVVNNLEPAKASGSTGWRRTGVAAAARPRRLAPGTSTWNPSPSAGSAARCNDWMHCRPVRQGNAVAAVRASRAVLKVRLRRAAADIARKESVFWIVRPEVGLGNISGLGTVITGPEIGVRPGRGEAAAEFIGRDTAPLAVEHKGLSVILRTPHLGALKANAPVYYRGVEVGVVQGARLSTDATSAEVRLLIRPGYARLVHAGSRFWKAGGIDVNLGLFSGLEINMESLRSLIAGGVAFATPSADTGGRPAASGSVFPLFDKPEKEWLEWAPQIAVQPEPVSQSMQ